MYDGKYDEREDKLKSAFNSKNKEKIELIWNSVSLGIRLSYDGKYDEREDKRKSAFNSKNKRKSDWYEIPSVGIRLSCTMASMTSGRTSVSRVRRINNRLSLNWTFTIYYLNTMINVTNRWV